MVEIIQQLAEFILHIDDHLVELTQQYGIYIYIILFLILFAETGLVITPFLPGDSLLFAAGALCASGNMNVVLLISICVAAAILGNITNFYIGKYVGPKLLQQKSKWIKEDYLIKTQKFYDKHGGKALILGRYLPFVRTFVPFVAGIGQMNESKFNLYNIVGALAWIVPIVLVGYWFGNIPFVKENFSLIVLCILIISLIPLIAGVIGSLLNFKKNN
ncbi:MAG TPA: DedA family protein [Saprospiraceae bacterium]|nr:DedA family protein [Saprospiraceae bacterium]